MPDAEMSASEVRVLDSVLAVEPPRWNALWARTPEATPFMRHEFLAALERSGSAVAATGWQPHAVVVERGGELLGACPLYLKSHSYGEYVFDWAWADAYRRHGLEYYPKLLVAVPFTPVPGARLLAADDATRAALLAALERIAEDNQLSSAHLLFPSDADRRAAESAGWMIRRNVQFHWHNAATPYRDFADFLAHLQRDKRKKIAQERRRVAEAGVTFDVLEGEAIDADAWDFFHRCYTLTYRAHHSTPYLTRSFFAEMQRTMPRHWVMFIAVRGGERIATSLLAIDPEQRVAWGRYWGAVAHVPLLHFEACYYRPLQWCIERGWRRFEGGAQGEHKMARGLVPERTHSAHWLAHPRFAAAVAEFLERESDGVEAYVDELNERTPFRRPRAAGGATVTAT